MRQKSTFLGKQLDFTLQDVLYGPMEVGPHENTHGSENASEEKDADASSKEVFCPDMKFQIRRHVFYTSSFQERQVTNDLHSEYIEISQYNDSPSADIEVEKMFAIEIL